MDAILDWMAATPINSLAVDNAWTWPAMETLHFLGLCLLMGSLLVMDLRLIGFQRLIPLKAVHALMPLAIAGFVINAITGIVFIFGDPHRYAINIAFQLKMLLILLAGLNFLLYYVKVEPRLAELSPTAAMPPLAKTVGAASLVFWFGVLTYGRLMPYLGTGGG